jgi:hypothetical protein
MLSDRFRYPSTINENAARLIAGAVVLLALTYLASASGVVLAFLAYGFAARVIGGSAYSPLALFVNRVLVPWWSIPSKPVPSPPKRFAQGIGAVLSVGALFAHFGGLAILSAGLVGAIAVAATLESVFAYCIGCRIFAVLMNLGVVPDSVCEACRDLSKARPGEAEATGSRST